jgi:GNAT superfamily N-acetyltransferase
MDKLPHVYFGQPEKPALDWRQAKIDERDDDQLRPMVESERKILGVDPVGLFISHNPENFVEKSGDEGCDKEATIFTEFQEEAAKSPSSIPIKKLQRTQPKTEDNPPTVDAYRSKIKRGKVIPPIKVVKIADTGMHRVVDGHHRLSAHVAEDKSSIPAKIIETVPHDKEFKRRFRNEHYLRLLNPRLARTIGIEKAGEHDDTKYHYTPLLRPAHFSTLPPDVKWDYAELPHDFHGNRPDLKRSKHRYGIIKVDRRLTPEERSRFDLKEIAKVGDFRYKLDPHKFLKRIGNDPKTTHSSSTNGDKTTHTFAHGVSGKPYSYAKVVEYPNRLVLDSLRTHKEHRGQGHASTVMRQVNEYADKVKKPIYTTAAADDIAHQKKLEGFYGKHGFQVKYNGKGEAGMYRPPSSGKAKFSMPHLLAASVKN